MIAVATGVAFSMIDDDSTPAAIKGIEPTPNIATRVASPMGYPPRIANVLVPETAEDVKQREDAGE